MTKGSSAAHRPLSVETSLQGNFDDFVHGLDLAITLRMVWCWEILIDAELIKKVPHHLIIELKYGVRNQWMRDLEPVDDVITDELGQVLLGDGWQRDCLDPMGEVIYRYDGKFKPSERRWQ